MIRDSIGCYGEPLLRYVVRCMNRALSTKRKSGLILQTIVFIIFEDWLKRFFWGGNIFGIAYMCSRRVEIYLGLIMDFEESSDHREFLFAKRSDDQVFVAIILFLIYTWVKQFYIIHNPYTVIHLTFRVVRCHRLYIGL